MDQNIGSALYQRWIIGEGDALQMQVWQGTPWMTNAFTGSSDDPRERQMLEWCWDQYGAEAWPFSDNPRPGRWKRGGATVFGWTWFGFSTEAEMAEFELAWPKPPEAS